MSEVKPHPISLEQVFFTRSSVIAVPGHQPNENSILAALPNNDLNVSKVENGVGRYSAIMRTTINQTMDPSSPYSIDMECVAVMVADATLNEEEATRGVMITANSVLYGAIREAVAWLTGRQPFGPVLLGLSVLQSKPAPTADEN
jgi:hypothetical protein